MCSSKVALSVGISQDYLGRIFKYSTGMSITSYLNRQRAMKARELLENTDLTIPEVMEKVGFSTAQHFFKQFKRYNQATPKSFQSR